MKTTKERRQIKQAELPDYTSDDDLLDALRAGMWWDCLDLRQQPINSVRLFGNANIGQLQLTNLQVPGQLATGSSAAVLQGWYMRTSVPHRSFQRLEAGFRAFLESTYATLVVGNMPRWVAPLSDLYRAGNENEEIRTLSPRPLWSLPVPPRQNVHVQVDRFYTGGIGDEFLQDMDSEYQPWSNILPRIWIHLEGVILPEYHDYDELDEERVKRYRRLVGRVMRLLHKSDKHVDDTATLVARWLGAQLPDNADSETKAQFEALADGIRERRFEGGATTAIQYQKSRVLEALGPLLNVQEGIAYLDLPAGDMAPVSPADRARLRVNLSTGDLEVSISAGAYRRVMLAGEP